MFLLKYLCAKSAECCQQLPPTQNPQDFPLLIQNCNQVTSLGKSQDAGISDCDVLWMDIYEKKKKVVLPARMWSQEHKRGNSGKLSGADCQNAHMTVTYGSNGEDGFSRHDPANAPTCDTQLQYHTDLWCFSSLLFWKPQNHVNNPVSTLKVKYDNQTITVRFRAVIKTREISALDHLKTYFEKKKSLLTKKKILRVKQKISNQTERFHDRSQR